MDETPKVRPIIVIKDTPEMANWMHPQTEERKIRVNKFFSSAAGRYIKLKQNIKPTRNSICNNTDCPIDE